MVKALFMIVLLGNLQALKCQEEAQNVKKETEENGNASYSYKYGVSDPETGDVKTVWEARDGDNIKGKYSVVEQNGSTRTVEYSAGPEKEDLLKKHDLEEETVSVGRSARDYGKFYDFTYEDDTEDSEYSASTKKKSKHPFDSLFKDYSAKKRPKYPMDLEPSEYTHSISIKHPHDHSGSESHHTHVGVHLDPNCKTKHKKEINSNQYDNLGELDLKKYPINPFYDQDYERYHDSTNLDEERIRSPYDFKYPKLGDAGFRPSKLKGAIPFYDPENYPTLPELPPHFFEDIPSRPRKKRPHKAPLKLADLDDYVLVPKKKLKRPLSEYQNDDEDYSGGYDEEEKPRQRPEKVIKKIIKKRKPVINLLDILDI